MLHYIKGQITMKFDGGVVIEAGGLGYEVYVPANSGVYLAKEYEEITLFTAMMVREDDVSLYGFGEKAGLDTFNKLITVSGVGAKAALALLSAMPVHEVQQAIAFEDAATLTRANGIGKKTAERIVLELKDKFQDVGAAVLPQAAGGTAMEPGLPSDSRGEAITALMALGYTKGEAVNAVTAVEEPDLTTETYIKLALKRLF